MVALQTRRIGVSIGWAIAGLAVVGVGLFVGAGWLGDPSAADHCRFHAISAFVSALVATAISVRWSRTGIGAWAPTLGFALYAAAQIVESVGALGYDTIRETRGDLALAHDVGLSLTLLGMLAIVAGLAVALAVASARQRGAARVVVGVAAVVVLGAGLLFVKVMIGM